MRLARLALLGALLFGTVAGCGLKGDLVLPDDGSTPAGVDDEMHDLDIEDENTDDEDRP